MIEAFEFSVLQMPAFMLGFAYHGEHPDTGFQAVVDYLGTVDRLIKEGGICLGKRGKEKNTAER